MIKYKRFVNSRFTSNTYILYREDMDRVWLVDPGDFFPVKEWMRDNGMSSIEGILLSHSHFDHIYGINDVLVVFPQAVVYVANEYGESLLHDAKKNGSRYTEEGAFVVKDRAVIRCIEDLSSILGNEDFEIICTPAHSDDSICISIDGYLFTGDTLIKDTRTVTKLKGGSVEKLKETVSFLEKKKGKNLVVCPGHGETFPLDGYDLSICWVNKLYD